MNPATQNIITRHRGPILFFVLALGLYFFLNSIVNEKIEDLTTTLQVQITEQQALLATIAEITARNGADTVTESIVKDCPVDERARFDSLLGTLDVGLAWNQLNELERLFGRCGSFSAQRKSVMVSRLTREIEVYEAYVTQLETLTNESNVEKYNVEKWNALASEEKKQSELFTELVDLQDRIISALLTGKAASSEEIVTILNQVKEKQETLLVANKQAATLRGELISL